MKMKRDFEECFWVYFIFLRLFLIESESEIKMKINGEGGGREGNDKIGHCIIILIPNF